MRAVLSANLKCLVSRRYKELDNVTAQTKALAKAAHVGHGTIQRAIDGDTAATLDTIERLAAALDVSVYQMLLPNLDCDNPQVVQGATAEERHLYSEFKRAALELDHSSMVHEPSAEKESYGLPEKVAELSRKRKEKTHEKK